jgi:Flp pilus assembly protein TadG
MRDESSVLRGLNKWHQCAGAVAVELALVLPLTLLIVDAAVEFSIIMFNKAIILNAAREAVRSGMVLSDPKKSNQVIANIAQLYADQYLISFGNQEAFTVLVSQSIDSSTQTPLSVSVSYRYTSLLAGGFLSAIKHPIILSETVTLMNE